MIHRALWIAALISTASAQDATINLVGSATLTGRTLRLTPAEQHMAGAAWAPYKQTIANGFETKFRFQITDPGGLGPGADGFAFVLQNSGPNALGGRGAAGGFALGEEHRYGKGHGIPQSIAVFFDMFQNGELHDPSDNFIVFSTAGRGQKMKWPPSRLASATKLPVRMKDGKVHEVRIIYHPAILSVELDGKRVLSSTVDLRTVLDAAGGAYAGFTSSIGSGFQNHDIIDWQLTPSTDSNAAIVSSDIAFVKAACLPDKNLCTPDRAVVEETTPGVWHVVLPANLSWGASVPGVSVEVSGVRGTVCWQAAECGGAEALSQRVDKGRTWFAIKDAASEGFLEFDVKAK